MFNQAVGTSQLGSRQGRVDLVDPETSVHLRLVQKRLMRRSLEFLGTFSSDDNTSFEGHPERAKQSLVFSYSVSYGLPDADGKSAPIPAILELGF